MRPSDFLNHLHDSMPNHTELEAYGLDSDEIDSTQRTFRSHRRNTLEAFVTGSSDLEKMIGEYDCSTVEVGLVRFLGTPLKHCCGVQVAYCEADPIVVHASGVVAIHDHDKGQSTMKCSIDSDHFLDALAAFVTLRREKWMWKGRAEAAAEFCATKAGGSDCLPFFRVLCGYLA